MTLSVALKILLLTILLVFIPFAFSACGGSGDDDPQGIIVEGGGNGSSGSNNNSGGDPAVCGAVLTSDAVLASDLYCGYFGEEVAIQIASDGVNLDCKGHSIAIMDSQEIIGIQAKDVSNIAIQNCTIQDASIGIHLLDVQTAKISGNSVFETGNFGIFGENLDGFDIKSNVVKNTENLINCIEIFDSTDGTINDNEVSGCGSGIDLYGSNQISVTNNTAHDIGDTGLGFFDSDDVVTHDITVTGNTVYNCGNIGAVEIMWGSYQMLLEDNKFSNSKSGIQVYDGQPSQMHDLVFNSNLIKNNEIGIYVLGDTYNLTVSGNELISNDIGLSLNRVTNVDILENSILLDEGKSYEGSTAFLFSLVESISANHNVIQGYETFMELTSGTSFDFKENHWDGCPDLSKFKYGDSSPDIILPLINPINHLPCFYNSNPMTLIDENADGFDDFDCQREGTNECIEEQ